MDLSFLTPLGALVALAAIVPLWVLRARARRDAVTRAALGLAPPRRRSLVLASVVVTAVFGLLAAAAAQPVVFVDRVVETRADAEAYVIVDVSRSMLASPSRGAPSRFERAIAEGIAVRRTLVDVPVGSASLTDRPLPNVFPTPDVATFEATLTRAIGIERPPPEEPGQGRATSLASLATLAKTNFFSAASTRRLAIVLTDAESVPFDARELVDDLRQEGIALVVVRLWAPGERIWAADGTLEPYRPDASAATGIEALEQAGAVVVQEGDRAGLAAAARSSLGEGPRVALAAGSRAVPLAAYVALAASLPLALLLVRGGGGPRSR